MAEVIVGLLYLMAGFFALCAAIVVAVFLLSTAGILVWLPIGLIWLISGPVLMLCGLARVRTCSEWMEGWTGVMGALWNLWCISVQSILYILFGLFMILIAAMIFNGSSGSSQSKPATA